MDEMGVDCCLCKVRGNLKQTCCSPDRIQYIFDGIHNFARRTSRTVYLGFRDEFFQQPFLGLYCLCCTRRSQR